MSADNPPPVGRQGGLSEGVIGRKGGLFGPTTPLFWGLSVHWNAPLHAPLHLGGGGFGWHVKWKNRMCFPPCPLPPRPRRHGLQLRRHPGQPSCWLGRGGCVPRWDGAGRRRGGAAGGDPVQHLLAWASLTLSGRLVSFFSCPFLCSPIPVPVACQCQFGMLWVSFDHGINDNVMGLLHRSSLALSLKSLVSVSLVSLVSFGLLSWFLVPVDSSSFPDSLPVVRFHFLLGSLASSVSMVAVA